MSGVSVASSNERATGPPSTIRANNLAGRKRHPTPRQTGASVAARDIVIASRAAGMSLEECARAAGVSVSTASKYVRAADKSGEDMSREGIISMLSLKLRQNDMAPQYIAPLVAILSKLKGWTDKAAEVVTVKPMGELFASWAAEIADNHRESVPNVGAPTCSVQPTPSEPSNTRASGEGADTKAGEPPVESVSVGVKSSPPPHAKF